METSYRYLSYDSGNAIQKMRNRIGLTQVGLAEYLGVSVRTVREWEAGGSHLKEERLKALIVLGMQYRAFANWHTNWSCEHKPLKPTCCP